LGRGHVPHGLQSFAFDMDPMPTEKAGYVFYLGGKVIGTYLNDCNALRYA